MEELTTIYRESFFKNRHRLAWRAKPFCKAIMDVFNPTSVVDAGCAIGDFVQEFDEEYDIMVWGIEGSVNCKPYLVCNEVLVDIFDLRIPFINQRPYVHPDTRFDLCMCLEVVEHIEPEYAKALVGNLMHLSNNILISAARPGQGGHHHVNCQEPEYWDKLFGEHEYYRSIIQEDALKDQLYPYRAKDGIRAYYHNLLVYCCSQN